MNSPSDNPLVEPRPLLLSPPDLDERDHRAVADAMASGWIAPVGPDLDRFEELFAELSARKGAVGLSSGTAALHLALLVLGVGAGDRVLVSTLTFAASANPIVYVGAEPVFVDADLSTWCLDPDLVAAELARGAAQGRPYRAVIAVDLYGQCADYDALTAACDQYDAALIVDAAESLGAGYRGRPAGDAGVLSVFSLNGNKIVTASSGGVLAGDDLDLLARARYLATQARQPVSHYEHTDIGHNYRLSNLLAALGRSQAERLDRKVAGRRANREHYRAALADWGRDRGLGFMPEADYGESNGWLTVITLDPERAATDPAGLIAALAAERIEARHGWKPLHLQPVFAESGRVGGEVAERIFATSVCLPSGTSATEADLDRVIAVIKRTLG